MAARSARGDGDGADRERTGRSQLAALPPVIDAPRGRKPRATVKPQVAVIAPGDAGVRDETGQPHRRATGRHDAPRTTAKVQGGADAAAGAHASAPMATGSRPGIRPGPEMIRGPEVMRAARAVVRPKKRNVRPPRPRR